MLKLISLYSIRIYKKFYLLLHRLALYIYNYYGTYLMKNGDFHKDNIKVLIQINSTNILNKFLLKYQLKLTIQEETENLLSLLQKFKKNVFLPHIFYSF